jgi:hypothetical protein
VGKSPPYPLNKRLSWAQGLFERCRQEKPLLPLLGIEGENMYMKNVGIHVPDIIKLMCGILLSSQEERHCEQG